MENTITKLSHDHQVRVESELLTSFPGRKIVQVADNLITHWNNRTCRATIKLPNIVGGVSVARVHELALKADAQVVYWCLKGHLYTYPSSNAQEDFSR